MIKNNMKVNMFGCTGNNEKFRRGKFLKKVMDYFRMNILTIVRLLVGFHRILGLTFGGPRNRLKRQTIGQ